VPDYTAVDVRWGWNITRSTELSLVVQNLFDRGHVEFGAASGASEWRRAVWLKLLWRM
jgi:iron complex outermembrane receptor protein